MPFRGTGPAMGELQAGRIDFLCEMSLDRQAARRRRHGAGTGDLRQQALAGAAKPADRRGAGHEDLIAYTWNAIFLPKNTPAPIVERLDKAAVDAMNTPAVKEKLAGLGAEIATGDRPRRQYLGKLVKDEIEKWAVPIKASGGSASTDRGRHKGRRIAVAQP